jgi:hypothetical protein
MAFYGMIPIVATLIVYGLKMVWTGKAYFDSVPYGETIFGVCWFALWGYLKAEHDWKVAEEKQTEAATSPNSANRADA